MRKHAIARVLMCGVFAVSAVGCCCVKRSEFDALKAEVDQTKSVANRALETANDAKAQAQRLEEVVNRGFKRGMYK